MSLSVIVTHPLDTVLFNVAKDMLILMWLSFDVNTIRRSSLTALSAEKYILNLPQIRNAVLTETELETRINHK